MLETILLQADTVNAMEDTHFTMKDVFYIAGLIVTILGGWFKMKAANDKHAVDIEALQKARDKAEASYREEVLAASNGRRAIKKEMLEQLEKKEQVIHTRIDRVRDDNLKNYDELKQEIKELAGKSEVHTQTILTAIQNIK